MININVNVYDSCPNNMYPFEAPISDEEYDKKVNLEDDSDFPA